MVGQAGDGQQGGIPKAHVYAEFIRAVGICDADGAGADLDQIVVPALVGYGQLVAFGDGPEVDGVEQSAVLVDQGGQAACFLQAGQKDQEQQAEGKYDAQQCAYDQSIFSVCGSLHRHTCLSGKMCGRRLPGAYSQYNKRKQKNEVWNWKNSEKEAHPGKAGPDFGFAPGCGGSGLQPQGQQLRDHRGGHGNHSEPESLRGG